MVWISSNMYCMCCVASLCITLSFYSGFATPSTITRGLPDEKMRHPLKNQASHQAVFAHRQRENGNNKINFCCSRNGQKNTTNAA
nr:hypothetical protein [Parageobacillus thermoglucosidasius]